MSLPHIPFTIERLDWHGIVIKVCYTPSWLDEAATLPAWRQREVEARQMPLF